MREGKDTEETVSHVKRRQAKEEGTDAECVAKNAMQWSVSAGHSTKTFQELEDMHVDNLLESTLLHSLLGTNVTTCDDFMQFLEQFNHLRH